MFVYRPGKIDAIIHNPGCGMLYLQRGFNKLRYDQVPADAWFLRERLTDKIAFSIPWSAVEPTEGRFRWDHPDWEGCIDGWIDAGFKVALEVRGMDTWGTLYDQGVPQWVFDAGARHIDEPLSLYRGSHTLNFIDGAADRPVRYPVYWDPVYLEKTAGFVRAMGRRYNGRPEIEWVNIGHMGRWGEMHLSTHSPLEPWLEAGLSREAFVSAHLAIIDLYREAFPDTPLCQEICAPVFGATPGSADWLGLADVPELFEHLARHGIQIKQNGIGHAWRPGPSRFIDADTLAIWERHWRRTRIGAENLVLRAALEEALDRHISYWHSGGEKEGLRVLDVERDVPLPDKRIFSYTALYPDEYARMGQEDQKDLWRLMARRCGYRLEIRELRIAPDGTATVHWHNSGSAPCYEPLTLELAWAENGRERLFLRRPVTGKGVETLRGTERIDGSAGELRLRLYTPRGRVTLGNDGRLANGDYHWQPAEMRESARRRRTDLGRPVAEAAR